MTNVEGGGDLLGRDFKKWTYFSGFQPTSSYSLTMQTEDNNQKHTLVFDKHIAMFSTVNGRKLTVLLYLQCRVQKSSELRLILDYIPS